MAQKLPLNDCGKLWVDVAELRDELNTAVTKLAEEQEAIYEDIAGVYRWQRLLLKGLRIIAADGGQPHHVADQLTALLEEGP